MGAHMTMLWPILSYFSYLRSAQGQIPLLGQMLQVRCKKGTSIAKNEGMGQQIMTMTIFNMILVHNSLNSKIFKNHNTAYICFTLAMFQFDHDYISKSIATLGKHEWTNVCDIYHIRCMHIAWHRKS